EKDFKRLLIRPRSFWAERKVTLLPECKVVAVDPSGRVVATSGGDRLAYEKLVWAAGGAPRRLTCTGHDLQGVYTIRNRGDVDRLRAELPNVARAVVVGGGYVGLETAAALVKMGKKVTLVEKLDRVLARVAGEPLSRF